MRALAARGPLWGLAQEEARTSQREPCRAIRTFPVGPEVLRCYERWKGFYRRKPPGARDSEKPPGGSGMASK